MIVREIDSDGDWTFGSGRNNYKKDNAAVGQSLATRLRSFLGDCFFDLQAGIDWFTLLGSKNLAGVTLSQKMTILNTQSVTEIVELSSVIDENRRLTTSYQVSTAFSTEEPLTGTVSIP